MFILKAYNSPTYGEIFHAPVFTDEDYLVYDATLTLGINKTGSLVFTIPPNNVMFGQLNKLKTIITVEKNGKEFWRGRVLQTETDFYMRSVVTCEGMLSYLMDSLVRPYTWEKDTGNVGAYFKSIVEQGHNPKVDSEKQFVVSTDMDDDMYAIDSDDYPNSLDELINNAVNIYGGYLKAWFEDGENHLSYTKAPGKYSTQTIEFGENLLDLKWDINAENVFTVLIPLGKSTDDTPLTIASVNGGKDYIESADGIEAYGRIVECETWDDIEDASELLETAQAYLAKAVEMATTLTINAADLSLLNVDVDAFNVGDYVRVISLPHGLNGDFLCTEAKIDLVNSGNSEYVFGFEDTLTQNTSGRDRAVAQINKIANKALTIAESNRSDYIERLWPRYRANYETDDLNVTPSNYMSVMEWDENTLNTPYSEKLSTRYTWGTVLSRNGSGKYEGVQISMFPGTPYLAIRYRPYNGSWSKWEWLPWQAEIDAMKTDIATNASNISKNASAISTNAANISTNAKNIATNTTNIAVNAQGIAQNKDFIEKLYPRYRANYYLEDANIPPSNWFSVSDCTADTLHTPYKENLVGFTTGVLFSRVLGGVDSTTNGIQIMMISGNRAVAIRSRNNGTWSAWELLPYRAEVETMKTNIATNTSNISKNASAIATNSSNIATNKTNIADNKWFIERLWPRYSANYPAGDKTFGYLADANLPPSALFCVCDCSSDTLNTPYKQGLTSYTTGILLTRCLGDVGSTSNHAVQMMLVSGSRSVAIRSRNSGVWSKWEWLPYRSEIETMKTNISTNTSNIATNASNITKNASAIATNKTNIADNKKRINAMEPHVTNLWGRFGNENYATSINPSSSDTNPYSFKIYDYDGSTPNTPYKAGLTGTVSIGVIFSRFMETGSGVQLAMVPDMETLFIRTKETTAAWTSWKRFPYYSGWKNVSFTSAFKNYSTSNLLRYQRHGNVVELVGICTPTSDIAAGSDSVTICTLASGFRPTQNVYALCQGTGKASWLCTINNGGNVTFSRYGKTSYETATAGVWLPIHITFLTNNSTP